jgi:hypothetical protein
MSRYHQRCATGPGRIVAVLGGRVSGTTPGKALSRIDGALTW